MRPLEKKVLVTFETTTSAMAFEAEAKKARPERTADTGAETDHGRMRAQLLRAGPGEGQDAAAGRKNDPSEDL